MHYYCPNCELYLGEVLDGQESLNCANCHCENGEEFKVKDLKEKGNFFLVNPVKDQLAEFLQNGNLAHLLFESEREHCIPGSKSDITTGDCYQSDKVQNFLKESSYNFTMSFNSDGVQLFESSSQSLWPLLCTINELTYEKKNDFVCMSTLYCNNKKPPRDAYLKCFVEETRRLREDGVTWIDKLGTKRVSKIIFLICVADAPARALLTNMTQYNGEYGCCHCVHPGVRARSGGGSMQVYPLEHPIKPERDYQSLLCDVEAAVQNGRAVNGVKGPSQLYLIPGFDVARGIVPEIMHFAFLGLSKQFIHTWKVSHRSRFTFRD